MTLIWAFLTALENGSYKQKCSLKIVFSSICFEELEEKIFSQKIRTRFTSKFVPPLTRQAKPIKRGSVSRFRRKTFLTKASKNYTKSTIWFGGFIMKK